MFCVAFQIVVVLFARGTSLKNKTQLFRGGGRVVGYSPYIEAVSLDDNVDLLVRLLHLF